jgi:pilus assembly protein Flp/PilA
LCRKASANPDHFSSAGGENAMLRRFIQDEAGMELSEYAVAAALITLTIVGAISLLGDNITTKITSLANIVK